MRTWEGNLVAIAAVLAGTVLVVACGGGGDTSSPTTTASSSSTDSTSSTGSTASTASSTTAFAPEGEDLVVTEEDLVNINTMTPVRGFFVDNLLGHLDEAVAIAEANEGGDYPVGTILQLIPTEVMVKRAAGFSPETQDWEFLFVEVTAEGTTILDRVAADERAHHLDVVHRVDQLGEAGVGPDHGVG
jgi:hypothetical protein